MKRFYKMTDSVSYIIMHCSKPYMFIPNVRGGYCEELH